jgi:hypothetical protein
VFYFVVLAHIIKIYFKNIMLVNIRVIIIFFMNYNSIIIYSYQFYIMTSLNYHFITKTSFSSINVIMSDGEPITCLECVYIFFFFVGNYHFSMNYHLITIYPHQLLTLRVCDGLTVRLNNFDWRNESFDNEMIV